MSGFVGRDETGQDSCGDYNRRSETLTTTIIPTTYPVKMYHLLSSFPPLLHVLMAQYAEPLPEVAVCKNRTSKTKTL